MAAKYIKMSSIHYINIGEAEDYQIVKDFKTGHIILQISKNVLYSYRIGNERHHALCHILEIPFDNIEVARIALKLIMECHDDIFDMEYFLKTQTENIL